MTLVDDYSLNADRFSDLAQDCRSNWLLGFLANHDEPRPTLNEYWYRAIHCSPERVGFLYALYSDDLDFARQVNAVQPNNAQGWFWLAELTIGDQPQQAIEYYRHGLTLDPTDSYRWRLLADALFEENDLPAALQAYIMACKTGDAGALGCFRSGTTAEKIGDYSTALYYYHKSHVPKAKEYADRLEKLLQQEP